MVFQREFQRGRFGRGSTQSGSKRREIVRMGIDAVATGVDEDGFVSHPVDSEDMYAPEEWQSVVPKSEIQATSFLEQHPEFDGRGVTIAILDTGVDPGASGLQLTTQHEKKIVDVVDCTGSGDVDMSTVREVDGDGCVEGIYGNKMKVNPEWKNPTNAWRVGSKRLYELYPEGLRHRMKKEKKATLEEYHNALLNKASVKLYEFNEKNPSMSGASDELKKEKEELEARVEVLTELFEKYQDFGPSIDCVVWHDGEKWLAALDTSQIYVLAEDDACGKLADFEPLTNYRDCRRYGTFSALDACNFALNIYDEGNTLSIVVDAGSHGTHVAGISAGYYPDDPYLNGIAPGAKIVSCKIGDTRLGSMETMTGLTRAYQAIVQNKCDLINMSYGEAASFANSGRFVRLADELVHKHHVIFVASAGNAGPALSTVGAPGGTSTSIMGIGAFVTPDLAKSGHSVRHAIESGAQYTWSSRGPTADGDLGVSISAPGGAITTVPQWTTQKKQLMNGTSMSSPCCCGGLALIVSAIKSSGMTVTPSLVRRAAENSAMPIKPHEESSKLTYGYGLLQVASCWEYLRQRQGTLLMDTLPDLHFVTSVHRSDGHYSGRGVYLRDPADSRSNRTFSVMVKPELHEDADVRDHKLNIDLKLRLSCTEDWVVAPSMLMLHHNGRQFEIEVNCEKLDYGLHYAEIQAFESSDTTGPLFRIPVCVVKPQLLAESAGSIESIADGPHSDTKGTTLSWNDKLYVPGMEDREYVMVPHGATWAELVIRPIDIQPSMACMVRATSLEPHTRYSDTEYRSFVRLTHGMEHRASFAVVPGSSLEITIAQFWSSFGKNKISTDLTFHGVSITPGKNQSFAFDESSLPIKAIIHAPIRSETIKPVCKLESICQYVRPAKSEMLVLSDPRNTLPGNRIVHNLVLSYDISLVEAGTITPKIPSINNYVYDGELSGQITIVSDKNKRVIGVGDIYAESMKVKKGDYNITVCLRHENPTFLKSFEDQVLQIERKLENSVSVPIYENYSDALQSKNPVKKLTLAPGEKTCIFVGKPSGSMPKDAAPGKVLRGTLKCAGTSADKQAPGGATVMFVCSPPKSDKSSDESDSSGKETIDEKMRAAKVSVLQKASDDDYGPLQKLLLAEYPGHLPILQEELKRAEKAMGKDTQGDASKELERLLSACNEIIGSIDLSELAIYVAKKNVPKGEEAEKLKKKMKLEKEALISALAAKTKALLDQEASEDLDATFNLLREWVDTSSEKDYYLLHARKDLRDGNYGLAIKHLNKIIDSEEMHGDLKDALKMRKSIIESHLVWSCWGNLEEERIRAYFPSTKLTL